MPKPLNNENVSGRPSISSGRVCPRCQGEIFPLKRGIFHTIIGHESTMYRYQCDSYKCSDREHEYDERSLTDGAATELAQETAGCACPRCGGETFRVERGLLDLFISRFSLVHRYLCDSRQCGWTGLVRQEQRTNSASN